MKICRRCEAREDQTPFVRRENLCKPCQKAIDAERYNKNPEPFRTRAHRRGIEKKSEIDAYNHERYRRDPVPWKESAARRRREKPLEVKDAELRSRYGVGLDWYYAKLEEQGGGCSICDGPPNGRGKVNGWFCIDHDHGSSTPRGLLCNGCNTLLGCAHDNIDVLRRAISYLIKNGKVE